MIHWREDILHQLIGGLSEYWYRASTCFDHPFGGAATVSYDIGSVVKHFARPLRKHTDLRDPSNYVPQQHCTDYWRD